MFSESIYFHIVSYFITFCCVCQVKSELEMNISTAFNIFVRQSLREGRIPFDISLNKLTNETIAAMFEAERIADDSSVKGYTDLDEMFADFAK